MRIQAHTCLYIIVHINQHAFTLSSRFTLYKMVLSYVLSEHEIQNYKRKCAGLFLLFSYNRPNIAFLNVNIWKFVIQVR